jgi:hypothetical protein
VATTIATKDALLNPVSLGFPVRRGVAFFLGVGILVVGTARCSERLAGWAASSTSAEWKRAI